MSNVELRPLPATAERFAPFGDLIDASRSTASSMNESRFERFDDLARIDIDGRVAASVVRSRVATVLPYRVDMLERHPMGSQAFIPLAPFRFVVVVAPAGESVDVADIRAFTVGPGQGVNYLRGTWHMPLIALQADQKFLVVDRASADSDNCEEQVLADPVMLLAP